MANFFAELKRRHVYRVAAAYALVAWMLLQLVNNLAPALRIPDWGISLVVVLLAVGFPIALIFAWIRELPPADGATARAATGKLDWFLAAALVAVIAIFAYQQTGTGARPGEARQASITPAVPGSISIAVLPFANVSADVGQEFFSDGMTDEIASALAKVKDLHVVARTSAFQFKGQSRDIQAIGQQLHATHLIEGSVRKAGDQVRITAQLVRADNGLQLWSENYDRQITNIFAIQEDIAQAIAGALRVPLGLAQGDTLVRNRTDNLESYQQYLRARVLYRSRALDDAIAILEPAVARDPGFAPGWGLLSQVYNLIPGFSPALRSSPIEEARRIVQSTRAKAEMAAQEANRLDPQRVETVWALAAIQYARGNWAAAVDLYRQSQELDPTFSDGLNGYAAILSAVGRIKDSLRLREQLRTVEPFVPIFNANLGVVLQAIGQNAASIPILEAVPPDLGVSLARNLPLANAYATAGRFTEAADTLLAIRGNLVSRQSVEDAARFVRALPAKASSLDALPALEGDLKLFYAYVGAADRILDFSERGLAIDYFALAGNGISLWHPMFAAARKTERFKNYIRRAGLLDYWRARGWPDLCRPQGADDFVCD